MLRDSSGEIKWLTTDELQKRATATARPLPVPMPGVMQYEGFVTVKLMINTNGDVVCLWGAAGNPIMIASAVRAIQQWKFKPMLVAGKGAEYVGMLKVPVSAASSPR